MRYKPEKVGFDLTDIPPAPRDKTAGREQKIGIKASSGLTEEEIKRMVHDAEAYAADDKHFRELIETRNKADAAIHAVEKLLADLGDKAAPADRAQVESAISELRTAANGACWPRFSAVFRWSRILLSVAGYDANGSRARSGASSSCALHAPLNVKARGESVVPAYTRTARTGAEQVLRHEILYLMDSK